MHVDSPLVGHYDQTLAKITQLAHVSRPRVTIEYILRGRSQRTGPHPQGATEMIQEMLRQHGYVAVTFAQGQNVDRYYIQTVEQIFAKLPFRQQRIEITIG